MLGTLLICFIFTTSCVKAGGHFLVETEDSKEDKQDNLDEHGIEKPVEQLNRAKVNSRSVDKKNLPKKFNRGDYPIYKWPKGIKAKIKNGKRQEDILSFKECVSTKCKRKSLSGVYTEAKYKDCLQRECGTWVWPIEWQEWSEWSDCSNGPIATCGKGSQIRARACSGDQGSCPGEFTETKDCLLKKCPASKWQEWGAWSVCSTTCGKGGKIRARACAGPPRSCQGKGTEAKGCRQLECGVGKLKRPKFKEAYYKSEKAKGKKLNKADGEKGDYVTWGLGLGRGFPGSKILKHTFGSQQASPGRGPGRK